MGRDRVIDSSNIQEFSLSVSTSLSYSEEKRSEMGKD